jgi:thiazolylpeptide-type bacteriocin precursor
MTIQTAGIRFDDIDVNSMNIEGLEVVSLKDALALPETGASSGISSTNSCSTCGSSSTCGSCQGGPKQQQV